MQIQFKILKILWHFHHFIIILFDAFLSTQLTWKLFNRIATRDSFRATWRNRAADFSRLCRSAGLSRSAVSHGSPPKYARRGSVALRTFNYSGAAVFIGYSLWRKKLEKFRTDVSIRQAPGSLDIRGHSTYLKAIPSVSVCERHYPIPRLASSERSQQWRWIRPDPFAESSAWKRISDSSDRRSVQPRPEFLVRAIRSSTSFDTLSSRSWGNDINAWSWSRKMSHGPYSNE